MKQIGNEKYYSKLEIAEKIGCCAQTVNNKITAAKVQGIYLGRKKYYTEAQISEIFNARTYKPAEK